MDKRQMIGFITGKPSKHPYPEHMQDGRRIAREGIVLLKNENNALPLRGDCVALFGAGAVETITCGTGSGYVFAPYIVTVEQGLRNKNLKITSSPYLRRFEQAGKLANKQDKTLSKLDRMWSGLSILIDELPIEEADLGIASPADTAIYVIRRNAGEGGDRKAEKGDYYLTDTERANLTKVAAAFKHTVVVFNTCVMDANFVNEIPGIDAAILMNLPGNEAGNALADVLVGDVSPSGHLTDTWAKRYEDNPASATFGENDGDSMQEDYNEDIFVGYRYFDTFGIEPLFPFGYGLSYSRPEFSLVNIAADWNTIRLTVQVKNIGAFASRHVVQVYATAPEGRLPKPYQELIGFAKTKELRPDDAEELTLTIPTEYLASYDETKAAFVMEPGKYLLRIGEHSRKTEIAAVLTLDAEAILRQVSNKLAPDHALQLLNPPKRAEEVVPENAAQLSLLAADCITIQNISVRPAKRASRAGNPSSTLQDVAEGRVSIADFVDSLDEEVLFRLVAGAADELPYKVKKRGTRKLKPVKGPSSSGSTTALFADSLGIPNWLVTDGPAGCHLPLCGATQYPVGMVIAQTWDLEASRLAGRGIGQELAYYNYSIILGPGMNIHRDPLCGRAFEYYAEDPLLSGKMAAATTLGVQETPGAGVSIKHFATNNQETNRLDENNTVSERALREIYLRGFEICVRDAAPKTVMTSYNKLNGVHTSSNPELLADILRGEWGFDGLVMTDWGTHSDKAADLAAGNDLIMGGYRSEFLKAAVHGTAPEFAADGFVVEKEFKVFGGFFTNVVAFWNAFVPAVDGPDTVSTQVAAGIALNEKVTKFVEDGIAAVTENPDGSRTVTYRGTNRGAYLDLEDVKTCATRTLSQLLDSVSYRVMMK